MIHEFLPPKNSVLTKLQENRLYSDVLDERDMDDKLS